MTDQAARRLQAASAACDRPLLQCCACLLLAGGHQAVPPLAGGQGRVNAALGRPGLANAGAAGGRAGQRSHGLRRPVESRARHASSGGTQAWPRKYLTYPGLTSAAVATPCPRPGAGRRLLTEQPHPPPGSKLFLPLLHSRTIYLSDTRVDYCWTRGGVFRTDCCIACPALSDNLIRPSEPDSSRRTPH